MTDLAAAYQLAVRAMVDYLRRTGKEIHPTPWPHTAASSEALRRPGPRWVRTREQRTRRRARLVTLSSWWRSSGCRFLAHQRPGPQDPDRGAARHPRAGGGRLPRQLRGGRAGHELHRHRGRTCIPPGRHHRRLNWQGFVSDQDTRTDTILYVAITGSDISMTPCARHLPAGPLHEITPSTTARARTR